MARQTRISGGTISRIARIIAIIGAALALAACGGGGGGGGGGSNDDGGSSARTYGGAGSALTLTFTPSSSAAGTFSFSSAPDLSSAVDGSVSGSYTVYSTGFMKLTVGASSGTASSVTVGTEVAALELPGFAVFAAPFTGSGSVSVLIPTGSCPSSDLSLGWVKSRVQGWTDAADTFGEFTYTASSSTAVANSLYRLGSYPTGPSVNSTNQSLGSGTCSGGKMHLSGPNVDLYLNAAGGALAHDITNDEIIAAMPTTSTVDGTDIGGNYAGISFSDSGGGSNDPFNVTLTAGAPATGTGEVLSDITTGAGTGVTGTFSLDDGPFSGSLTGTLTTAGPNVENIACMALTNAAGSGKKVITCGSENSDGTYFSLFMVEK